MNNLLSLIKKHEGTGPIKNDRLMPYKDTEGFLTVGYGRCIEKIGISQREAEYLLNEDIESIIHDCSQFAWFNVLGDARQAVIISMIFNLGFNGFSKFKKTIRLLEKHDYRQASTEMLNSKWAKQVGQRATELSLMLRSGSWL